MGAQLAAPHGSTEGKENVHSVVDNVDDKVGDVNKPKGTVDDVKEQTGNVDNGGEPTELYYYYRRRRTYGYYGYRRRRTYYYYRSGYYSGGYGCQYCPYSYTCHSRSGLHHYRCHPSHPYYKYGRCHRYCPANDVESDTEMTDVELDEVEASIPDTYSLPLAVPMLAAAGGLAIGAFATAFALRRRVKAPAAMLG